MPAIVRDGSVVRSLHDDKEYNVLELDESTNSILVALVDAEEDETGYTPGFWSDIANFEVKVLRQDGFGTKIYEDFEEISGFPESFSPRSI